MKTKNTDETIAAMLAHIESECTAIDREAQFDAMLDECYSFESIGGPFAYMSPSSVLKECDPTAYRCGVNDWADGEGWVEINGSNYQGEEAEKARDEFIEKMESELSDLETELEEAKETQYPEDSDDSELAPLQAEIAELTAKAEELNAQIAACQKYAL
jgi:DNA repair exonuclease SbcCD ATPase subunit